MQGMPGLPLGGWGFRSKVRHTDGSSFPPCRPSSRLCRRAGTLDVLSRPTPGESRRRAAFLRYLEIDLFRLAALLFLVQVQDPHVGSSAACEEQELVKARNVILALLQSCALREALGQEQPSHRLLSGREGLSLSSTHTSPGRRQPRSTGEDAGSFRTSSCPPYSICTPRVGVRGTTG